MNSRSPGPGQTVEGPAPVWLGAGQGCRGAGLEMEVIEVDAFWPRAPHWWRPDVVVDLGVMEVLKSREVQ